MVAPAQRILVVGPAWVGDMVMAQTLFQYLREVRGATVDVLAPDWSLPLLGRMPQVRRAIRVPAGHGELGLGERWRVGKTLRAERYDQAIVLPRSLKSALIPFFARIPRRTGYRGEMRYGLLNDVRHLDERRLSQVIYCYVALGEKVEADKRPVNIVPPQLTVDTANRSALVERLGLDSTAPVIALAPGAEYGPAKRWAPERFAAVACQLLDRGYQVWQFGSARDREQAEAIDRLSGSRTRILCGETALVDAVDLFSLTRVLVTNDSGLMHVAAAVGAGIVAIYGSTTPDYTPPLTRHRHILYQRLECSPCFERTCPKAAEPPCLEAVSVDQVLQATLALIEGGT
jgi:heptosyltransferase-2